MKFSARSSMLYATLLALAITPCMQAWSLKKAVGYTATAAFLASIIKYKLTKPNKNPVRYNLEELKSGKNLPENLKYLVLDGLIGHAKGESKIVVDPKDLTLKVDESTKAEAKGLYGNLESYYLKPILSSLAFVGMIRELKKGLRGGVASWGSFTLDELTTL